MKSFIEAAAQEIGQTEIKDFNQVIGSNVDHPSNDVNEFLSYSCIKAIKEKEKKNGGLGIWNNKN